MKLSLHLGELRKRIFLILVVLAVTMVGGLLSASGILNYLRTLEPANTMSWNVFSPWDSIRLYMQIAFIVSVGVSMPFILHRCGRLFDPVFAGKRGRRHCDTFRWQHYYFWQV